MVDEKLRKEMCEAYANGDSNKALRLSRKLDKQILSHYLGNKRTIKNHNKEKTLEI